MLVTDVCPDLHRAVDGVSVIGDVLRIDALKLAPGRRVSVAPVDLELDRITVRVLSAKSKRDVRLRPPGGGAGRLDHHRGQGVVRIDPIGASQSGDLRV